MIIDRRLDWDGCFNVRWSALQAHGIRTIIDLRNDDELKRDIQRPAGPHGYLVREVIISTLDSLDVDAYVRTAGHGDEDLAALRARLLNPAT
ncbi:MAG: hypothetical protein ACRDSF_22285 [Pseudonocardiaceae bacterium]